MSQQRGSRFVDGLIYITHSYSSTTRLEGGRLIPSFEGGFLNSSFEHLTAVVLFFAYAHQTAESFQKCQKAYVIALDPLLKQVWVISKKKTNVSQLARISVIGHGEKNDSISQLFY